FTPRGATPGSPSFPTRRSSDLLLYPWLIILLFDLFVEVDWPLKRALSACPACSQQAVGYLADRRPLRFFSELAEIFDAFHLSPRSEEHTSELQSREKLVCRLLL